MKDPGSSIDGAVSPAVVWGRCCSGRHQKVFCQTALKRQKPPLQQAHMHSHECKQNVCVCETGSLCRLIGGKLNYCGSLTEHDLRKMRYFFALKTRFGNIILGTTATVFCPGVHVPQLRQPRDAPTEGTEGTEVPGLLLGSDLTGSRFSVYINGWT